MQWWVDVGGFKVVGGWKNKDVGVVILHRCTLVARLLVPFRSKTDHIQPSRLAIVGGGKWDFKFLSYT